MREILSRFAGADQRRAHTGQPPSCSCSTSRDKPALKTFDYIRRFAQFVVEHRWRGLQRAGPAPCGLADGLMLTAIEPPCWLAIPMCWNTTASFCAWTAVLPVTGGDAAPAGRAVPAFFPARQGGSGSQHADVDHAGLLSLFDRACMSRDCYENFALEERGKANFREQNPLHAPYCALSKVISAYAPPIWSAAWRWAKSATMRRFPTSVRAPFGPWKFDFYHGKRRPRPGRDGDRLRKIAAAVSAATSTSISRAIPRISRRSTASRPF